MAANPAGIYKEIDQKIKDLDTQWEFVQTLDDRMSLEAEIEALREDLEELRRPFDDRRRLYRILLIVDSYARPDDIPDYIFESLKNLVSINNGSPEFLNHLMTNKQVRQKTLDKLKVYLTFFYESELDEEGQQEVTLWDLAGDWIDSNLYLQLIQPANPIAMERLKREPIKVVSLIARELVKNPEYWSEDLTSADELIAMLKNPNNIALVAARRGNLELLHQALESGASNYGEILKSTLEFYAPGEKIVFTDTIDRKAQELIRKEMMSKIKETPDSIYSLVERHFPSSNTIVYILSKNGKRLAQFYVSDAN